MPPDVHPARPEFQVLVTAAQAWPAFETAILEATHEISMGFRIFDLTTKLRSDRARGVGTDWFDLLAHKLEQGVRVRLVVSDFDPVMGDDLHRLTVATLRQAAAMAELVGPKADLRVSGALHPARAGSVWRSVLGPLARMDKGVTPPLATVTLHQKLAVIDREWLYIGGLDLNERRFDTQEHDRPADETWTDVQLLLRGPEAAEAADHLEGFVAQTHGRAVPPPTRYLRRTLSKPRAFQAFHLSPRTVLREIEADHLRAIRDAEQLIYIETQFLRSSRIARALARAAMEKPSLRLILVLPALPDDVAFEQNRDLDARYGLWLSHQALKRVTEAFGPRATVLSPVTPVSATREGLSSLAGSPIIYVHSKVLIADDRFALVGSANLNGRSLRWDTEAAVALRDPARISTLRKALTAHWWGGAAPQDACDLGKAQTWWQAGARKNAAAAPTARRGFLVPHEMDRLPELRVPLPGVPEDVV